MTSDVKLYAHHRDIARDSLKHCINELVSDGVSYKQIASTLTEELLEIIANERFEITYPSDFLEGGTEEFDMESDRYSDETIEEYQLRIKREDLWKKQARFRDSAENRKLEKLQRKAWKMQQMNEHQEHLKIQMSILRHAPCHIKFYTESVGAEHIMEYDARYLSSIEEMLKAYTVLQNEKGIDLIYELSTEIGRLLPEEKFDVEILESKKTLIKTHLENFRSIKEFLASNENFKQSKLYSALSLDSRKLNYLFVTAEKYKAIKRIRSGDSWLVSLV
jgi:hypothetical protein